MSDSLGLLSVPPLVNGLKGRLVLSVSLLVALRLMVGFLVRRRRGDFGDRVGDGGTSEFLSFLSAFGDLGDLGERGTLVGNSSILSLVLTLRKSSESLSGMCVNFSDVSALSIEFRSSALWVGIASASSLLVVFSFCELFGGEEAAAMSSSHMPSVVGENTWTLPELCETVEYLELTGDMDCRKGSKPGSPRTSAIE